MKLRTIRTLMSKGVVGTETPLIDFNGIPLKVGDIVKTIHSKLHDRGESVVVYQEEKGYNGYFIMGIEMSCRSGSNFGDWTIIKVKDYSEMNIGDVVELIEYVED